MERSKDVIFVAYPLGGKDTQANLLINYFKKNSETYLYVATGQIFRDLESVNPLFGEITKSGNLAPDSIATGLVVNLLVNNLTKERNLIFNGFPRSKKQGESFVELMKFFDRKPVVILIKVSKEEIGRRLSWRKGTETRCDDTEEIVKKRLDIFEKEYPLINFLKEHFEFHEVFSDGEAEDLHRKILEILVLK